MNVLFDLDGTLLDTAPDFLQVINLLREKEKLPPLPFESLRPQVSNGIAAMLKVGLSITPEHQDYEEWVQQFLSCYSEINGDKTTFFPGMLELLETLEHAGIRWGIVTNKRGWLTTPLLKKLNLDTRASCVVSGDTTEFFKPHPLPLQFAANQLKCEPNHCVFIGDAEFDIIAGKAAGMRTVLALFGYIEDHKDAKHHWGADHHVENVHELWPLIKSL